MLRFMTLSSLPLQATHVVVSLAKLCGGSPSPSARESEGEQKCMFGAAAALVFLSSCLQKPLGTLHFAISFCQVPVFPISHDPCLWQQHMSSEVAQYLNISQCPPTNLHTHIHAHTEHHMHARLFFNHTRKQGLTSYELNWLQCVGSVS